MRTNNVMMEVSSTFKISIILINTTHSKNIYNEMTTSLITNIPRLLFRCKENGLSQLSHTPSDLCRKCAC